MLECVSGLTQIEGEDKGVEESEGGSEWKIEEQFDPIGMYSQVD